MAAVAVDSLAHAATSRRKANNRAMTDSEFVFLYSTFPDEASAKRVAEALVGAKLAACVNIFGPMTSIYEWQSKLETAAEFAALIKTRRALADSAIAAARPLHPYSLPCFLVLPIDGGFVEYLDWARAQTKP
jgi:periplasmic divalent cation tolerance protein